MAKHEKNGGEKKAKRPCKACAFIKKRRYWFLAAAFALILLFLLALFWPQGGERATTAQAQSIAKMLKENDVPIRAIRATRSGYEITYAAEDAVGRFDDAILYDWGMIYGTAAAHDCEEVSVVTTLGGTPLHEQTVPCEAVRQFVRGVFTEEEFWLLVEHESPS